MNHYEKPSPCVCSGVWMRETSGGSRFTPPSRPAPRPLASTPCTPHSGRLVTQPHGVRCREVTTHRASSPPASRSSLCFSSPPPGPKKDGSNGSVALGRAAPRSEPRPPSVRERSWIGACRGLFCSVIISVLLPRRSRARTVRPRAPGEAGLESRCPHSLPVLQSSATSCGKPSAI